VCLSPDAELLTVGAPGSLLYLFELVGAVAKVVEIQGGVVSG
jgi:hypothetical protein